MANDTSNPTSSGWLTPDQLRAALPATTNVSPIGGYPIELPSSGPTSSGVLAFLSGAGQILGDVGHHLSSVLLPQLGAQRQAKAAALENAVMRDPNLLMIPSYRKALEKDAGFTQEDIDAVRAHHAVNGLAQTVDMLNRLRNPQTRGSAAPPGSDSPPTTIQAPSPIPGAAPSAGPAFDFSVAADAAGNVKSIEMRSPKAKVEGPSTVKKIDDEIKQAVAAQDYQLAADLQAHKKQLTTDPAVLAGQKAAASASATEPIKTREQEAAEQRKADAARRAADQKLVPSALSDKIVYADGSPKTFAFTVKEAREGKDRNGKALIVQPGIKQQLEAFIERAGGAPTAQPAGEPVDLSRDAGGGATPRVQSGSWNDQ